MAELPKLPPNILRLHSLRWDQLLEKQGFTGEHLKWHASRERRRQAAQPPYSLAPPPATRVTDRTSGRRILYGTDREPAPYQKWLEQEREAWIRREDDPEIVDSIGVSETVTLAKARLSEVIIDYWKFWSDHSDLRSEEFSQWSIAIARSVIREIGELWGADQWHAAWFERACQKKIQEALVPLTKEWAGRASKLEIQSLENPHLRIESLLQADESCRKEADGKAIQRPRVRRNGSSMPGKTDNWSHLVADFPNRASWLKLQMLERGWSNADPAKYCGPDRKTIEKILKGEAVRNDVLEKLAAALSKKLAKISVIDIPQD